MSEMQHFTGKLIKLPRRYDQTIEDQAKEILGNVELDSWNSTYVEQLREDDDDKYVIIEDVLYEIKDLSEKDPDDHMYNARKINGNDYEFEVRFYNGGTYLGEAVSDAVEKIKK